MIRKFFRYVLFRIKLKRLDDIWYKMGGSCFGLFPPSFYYLHTQEEADRIVEREMSELRAMLEEYECRYCAHSGEDGEKGDGG